MEYICNRLMAVGPKALLKKFNQSHWDKILQARHSQLVENSPGRYINEFNTEEAPIIDRLRKLSRRWPKLTFLLDWEWEDKRLKGFVNAKAGLLDSYRWEY